MLGTALSFIIRHRGIWMCSSQSAAARARLPPAPKGLHCLTICTPFRPFLPDFVRVFAYLGLLWPGAPVIGQQFRLQSAGMLLLTYKLGMYITKASVMIFNISNILITTYFDNAHCSVNLLLVTLHHK